MAARPERPGARGLLLFWRRRADRPVVADVRGSGRPVLLLHGQPGSAEDWRAVADDLATDHRVVVPDRLGWGRTGGKAAGFAANANALVKLLYSLEASPALLVGHSWAGAVALEMALDFPGSASALGLVSPVGPGEPVTRLDRLLAWPLLGPALVAATLGAAGQLASLSPGRALAGRRGGGHHEQLLALAASWRRPATWHSFAVEQRALVDELPSLAPRLGSLRVPALVVVGSADHVVPAAAGRRLAERVPRAELEVVDGAGHLLPQLQPARVASAIRRLARRPS